MATTTRVVQTDNHYLTWALRRIGTRRPVVIPVEAVVTFRAQHHLGGDPVAILGVDEEPADWTIGLIAIRITADDVLEQAGTWTFSLTITIPTGIEQTVSTGTIDVVPRT